MVQAARSRPEIRRQARRTGLFSAFVLLALLNSSCANLAKVKDSSIPRLVTPLAEAKFENLIKQLQPFLTLQSLRTTRVGLSFLDAESAERWRESEAILVLQRPDKIRLIIQLPAIKTKIAEMVSESNHFKVAVFYGEFRRFLIGTNNADYGMWRVKLGDKGRSALVAARPFHFTEALMMRPLNLPGSAPTAGNTARFTYSVGEELVEEPDPTPKAKKGARVLRSFYVLSEVELPPEGNDASSGASSVRRRFWFDRTHDLRFTRQQIFDAKGEVVTDVQYSDYRKLSGGSPDLWPAVILVTRPHDGYSARLLFSEERFEVTPDLPANAFVLENTDKLPEIDLDKPPTQ
jgi:hypothetical protein